MSLTVSRKVAALFVIMGISCLRMPISFGEETVSYRDGIDVVGSSYPQARTVYEGRVPMELQYQKGNRYHNDRKTKNFDVDVSATFQVDENNKAHLTVLTPEVKKCTPLYSEFEGHEIGSNMYELRSTGGIRPSYSDRVTVLVENRSSSIVIHLPAITVHVSARDINGVESEYDVQNTPEFTVPSLIGMDKRLRESIAKRTRKLPAELRNIPLAPFECWWHFPAEAFEVFQNKSAQD